MSLSESRLLKIRTLLTTLNASALIFHERATKIYLDALPGSGVWLVVTEDAVYQILDGRYQVAALPYEGRFINIVTQQGSVFSGVLAWIAAHKPSRVAIESELPFAQYKELARECSVVSLEDAVPLIRAVKAPDEIAKVQAACQIGDRLFPELCKRIHVGMTENEVVGELYRLIYYFGASGASFDPVVSSGRRTAMPHGRATERKLEDGDFLLLDYGVIKDGYQSDMTRTVSVGHMTDQFRNLHGILDGIQQEMVTHYLAGNIGSVIHKRAVGMITAVKYGNYFNHGLGHGLGIGGGERPFLNATSADVLKPKMICTCEPGIYLPQVGGIRIEDDVLITNGEPTVLTKTTHDLIVVGA